MMEETRKCPYCGKEIMATAKKCRFCGEWLDGSVKTESRPSFNDAINNDPHSGESGTDNTKKIQPSMKVWKLVSGILSIVLTSWILFQSCAVGVVNAIDDSEDASGSTGMFVAIVLLAAGIVSVATKNSFGKGGNIAVAVLYGMASLCAFSSIGGTYEDLIVWGIWCLVCAILAIVAIYKNEKIKASLNNKKQNIMEIKQLKLRFFILFFGMFCIHVMNAQIADDQKYIMEEKNVIDTDKVYEIAYQKINVSNEKWKQVDNELKLMLANIGKNAQNEKQRKLLSHVLKSYIANHSNTRPFYNSSYGVILNVISDAFKNGESKAEKDVASDIISKKLKSEIQLYDDTVSYFIENNKLMLSNIRKFSIDKLNFIGDLPLKKINVQQENPYYRPDLVYRSSVLDELDEMQQTVGWEWVKNEEGISKSESYPYSVDYYYYESHPQYKLPRDLDGQKFGIYTNDGTLVRVIELLRNQIYDVSQDIILLQCIQDFNNDKYNINSEGKSVNLAIKYKLGILKKPSTKAQTAAAESVAKAMVNRFRASVTGDYRREHRAKVNESRAFLNALSAYKMTPADSKASHYVSQLEKDHENDLNTLYKIERIDDTSFKLIYVDDKGINNCTVKIHFFNNGRYNSDCKFELLPNDTKQINMPEKSDEYEDCE